MTAIVEWAVRNTRVVIALILVALVAGVIAFIKIPKEAQPDIPIPVLIVQDTYPGISPEDSERLLVKPLETALRSVEGIKTMTARAYSGVAVSFWSSTSTSTSRRRWRTSAPRSTRRARCCRRKPIRRSCRR